MTQDTQNNSRLDPEVFSIEKITNYANAITMAHYRIWSAALEQALKNAETDNFS